MSTATANGSRDMRCVATAEIRRGVPVNKDENNARYLKQRLVPEIGQTGQARLARSRVLCIGAGGLGCASLPYLAGAGVGQITIIDDDRVERSNLQRQVLFGESDLGLPKAQAALRRLSDLNPQIELQALDERLSIENVESLFRDHDLVLDGSDNYATKFLCGDASVKFGVPLIYASATGMEAMVTLFDAADGGCLRCLFPSPPTGWVPNCAEAGVLGPLVGMAGCIQATEAVMWLVTGRSALNGRLWWLDARAAASRQLELRKRSECRTCSAPCSSTCAKSMNSSKAICPVPFICRFPVSTGTPTFRWRMHDITCCIARPARERNGLHKYWPDAACVCMFFAAEWPVGKVNLNAASA